MVNESISVADDSIANVWRGIIKAISRIRPVSQSVSRIRLNAVSTSRIKGSQSYQSLLFTIARVQTITRIVLSKAFISRIVKEKSFISRKTVIAFISRIRPQIPSYSRVKKESKMKESRISLIKTTVSRIRNIFKSE